ncbi:glycoside hydrolase family 6 protein [Parafrankia discariae]|uniref:glycoside hydrolase family 6 protein n=1 Tax=Parafrankia discariae TaxID=365528 RepID=UPI0003671E36|nr:glycoside hydrolase family 6 protein [Parafrankia discariae]
MPAARPNRNPAARPRTVEYGFGGDAAGADTDHQTSIHPAGTRRTSHHSATHRSSVRRPAAARPAATHRPATAPSRGAPGSRRSPLAGGLARTAFAVTAALTLLGGVGLGRGLAGPDSSEPAVDALAAAVADRVPPPAAGRTTGPTATGPARPAPSGLTAVQVPVAPLTGAAPSVAAQAPPVAAPPAPAAATAGNPFAGARFYIDPADQVAAAINALRGGNPSAIAALEKILRGAHADWFGYADPATTQRNVAGRATTIRGSGALPVFVAYAIPNRDCGSYSAGGAGGTQAYRDWIAAFAAGLSGGPAAVVLEPDAIAQIDCLSPADQQTRYGMLSNAVDVLDAAGATVYLDAGNAGWHSAATMAARLKSAGVDRARGFALNVSNFGATAGEVAFGDAVDATLGGGAHFIVDTSRNGLGPAPDNAWCNPPGRALGTTPTAATGDSDVDAFFWVKVPGESDGTCNGGPAAGQFWPDYAVGLGSRTG